LDLLNWKAFDRTVDAGYRYAIDRLAQSRDVLRLDRNMSTVCPVTERKDGKDEGHPPLRFAS
jgi:hypothetical protein